MIEPLLRHISDEDADEALVEIITKAMEDKLRKKRDEGYGGWHHDTTNAQLLQRLKDHISKGDMIDVINFAAMIYVREQAYREDA